ncbi:MAG TPA: hypothetical protein VIF09_12690 [Polyangiaceae bacterium]|jgi:hypothetical protein
MHPALRLLVAAVPVVAVFACGGRVDLLTNPPDHPSGDDGGCSGNAASCYVPPEAGVCPPPSYDFAGSACSTAGQACALDIDICGYSQQETCTCVGGGWSCPPTGAGCPAPTCPPAQDVIPGDYCVGSLSCADDQAIYDCSGNFTGYGQCECIQDNWACTSSNPGCPPPDPPCQPPDTIYGGEDCFSPLQQCPGNPTVCDGAVFYDDFECEGGQWVDVAPTICAVDAGAGSSSSSGGAGI